jgi:hypothetical protein
MRTTVSASTGARVDVWRQDELLHARLAGHATEPEICVAMDLFEVIADLAGLDLENDAASAEATRLAFQAQRRLGLTADV